MPCPRHVLLAALATTLVAAPARAAPAQSVEDARALLTQHLASTRDEDLPFAGRQLRRVRQAVLEVSDDQPGAAGLAGRWILATRPRADPAEHHLRVSVLTLLEAQGASDPWLVAPLRAAAPRGPEALDAALRKARILIWFGVVYFGVRAAFHAAWVSLLLASLLAAWLPDRARSRVDEAMRLLGRPAALGGFFLLQLVFFKPLLFLLHLWLGARARAATAAPLPSPLLDDQRWVRNLSGILPAPRYGPPTLLGRGGMGLVFRVRDSTLGRDVAVKLLDPDLRADPAMVQRFLREARALAAVSHPGLPAVHDVSEEPLPLLVMELLEGRSLRARLDDEGPLDPDAVAATLRAAGEALAALHAAGIVHRDIKPDNLMEGSDGRVRVIDLGLARDDGATRLTGVDQVVGSPAYMAPEQLRGEAGDARTDVYALAVTGFELLTGEYPYTQAQVLAGVEGTRKLLPPEVPPGLEAALRAGLCLDAAARPGSMDAFLARLEGAGSAEETPGDGASAIEAAPNASPTPPDSPPSPPPEGAVDAAQLRALGELYTVALHPAKNLLAEVAREADPEVAARWLQTEGPRADLERHRARTLDAAPLPAALAPGRDAAAAALGAFLDGGSVVAAWEAWRDLTAAAADLLDAHRLRPGAEALEPLLERPPARTLTLERGAWADRSLRAPDPGGARDGLRSLVADLLRNAEFAGATRVHLDLAREGPGLRLDLRDDGPGAGREDPAATRVQQGRSASSPGMGTGLASARRWLEARGGGLEAGDHPEGGFFVTVRLPAVLEL